MIGVDALIISGFVFNVMIGIYKITSPSGKIYIGQSNDIEKRFKTYKGMHCKSQVKLYRSLIKHGFDNHIFEIIEECLLENLNDRERYYQDLNFVLGTNGLNCKLTQSTDKIGKHSDKTKAKISASNIGKTIKKESIEKARVSLKKRYDEGFVNPRKGAKMTDKSRAKLSKSRTGFKSSEATKEKIRISLLGHKRLNGRTLSDSHKLNCKINATKYKSKLVLDNQNGIFYDSAKELSDLSGIPHSTLRGKLNGSDTNNTNFVYA